MRRRSWGFSLSEERLCVDCTSCYETTERLKCAFYTVVVQNSSLTGKYPGGLQAFVEKHGPRCNNDISVTCHMGSDVELVVEDLAANALQCVSDFVCFDAARFLLDAAMTGMYEKVDFQTPWLAGEPTKDGFFVWYRD